MKDLTNRRVLVPLATIFVIQAILTMASYVIPVIVPDAADDIGVAPDTLAALVSVIYFMAMVSGLGTGSLLWRLGPARVFQLLLVLCASGIAAIATAEPWFAVLGAALIGLSTGPMNPTGSHVLAAVAPARWQPFVFSLKQCGTPAGGMLAGALVPPLVLLFGWQAALAVVPVTALILVGVAGAFLRSHQPAKPAAGTGGSVRQALGLVVGDPGLRRLALGGLLYAGCQVGFASYLVVYLWRAVGFTAAEAGLAFSVLHLAGIGARVILGFVAGRHISTGLLLVVLGFLMAAGVGLATLFAPEWPRAAIFAVIALIGISGNGWVGLFFAEAARLAPAGRTADAAGGGQFFMYMGIVGGPLLCRELIHATGGYTAAIAFLAAAALVAAILLSIPGPHRGRRDVQSR